MERNIKFTVDHDTGYPNKAFLIGDFNGQRFIEVFNKDSWLNFSLMFSKYLITKRFKIIYGKKIHTTQTTRRIYCNF